jgi:hypothetical protein
VPDERRAAVGGGGRALRAGLRVHLHHGSDRLANEALLRKVRAVDVVVTSYDIATRDVDVLRRSTGTG